MRKFDQSTGYTWLELIVVLAVIVLLIALALPAPHSPDRAYMTQALSNMKNLRYATEQMAQDGLTVGWPGDHGGTFTNWAAQLVPYYLSTNDFCNFISVAGHITLPDRLPSANTNGIRAYAVSSNSPADAIFLATENIDNTPHGPKFDAKVRIFSKRGFVVFHKGGDGAILLPKQITNAAAVGTFVPLCQ